MKTSYILLPAFVLVMLLVVSLDFHRGLAYVAMGTAMAATSYIVYYKKLEFLAAGSTHSALLATAVGLVVEHYAGVGYYLVSIPLGLLLVYVAGALTRKRGVSPEKASAIIVSAASALAVIVVYYALTAIPARLSLSALILGDPLLLTRNEVYLALTISALLLLCVTVIHRVVVELSVDPVSASLAGVHVELYELLSYTVIGIASVGLLRLAGYVMEHVLLLLPAIVASAYAKSSKEHFVLTVLVGGFAASLGYFAGLLFYTVPTGVTGLVLIFTLALKYLAGRG